jgi:hypothetical protein
MNLDTSVPDVRVVWSVQESHRIAASAFREMAEEKAAAGLHAEARELERLAAVSEATVEAAREAWDAQFGEAHQETEHADQEVER